VATVYVRGPLGILRRRDVGLEMLNRGFATVYEAKTGAEFGGKEEIYSAAEARAKAKERGVWGRKVQETWESPRAYKTRIRAEEAGGRPAEDVEGSDRKGSKRSWFWWCVACVLCEDDGNSHVLLYNSHVILLRQPVNMLCCV
jgi:hypothetical protein